MDSTDSAAEFTVIESASTTSDDPGGSGSRPCDSAEKIPATPQVDSFFNFQLVVFQVGDTLFQVVRNGFEIPGTIFEAMFALPSGNGNETPIEGTSLENPIILDGVAEEQFRAFLRAIYPFAGRPPVTSFEDWLGVLHLATMWEFKLLRGMAIKALSDMVTERNVKEQIFLGVQYRVAHWVRDGYTTIAQRQKIECKELEKNPFALSWETIAWILAARDSIWNENYCCCGSYHGVSYKTRYCRCQTLTAINQVFREELEALEEFPSSSVPPLPQTTQ
ncbi:hypothetical protein M413DRAFT_448888 [Hebeloma cylindrosporum]|uniref:BTB domain-containing protein n=1 Tax=Hebeloma cylindrosporum TaxID=76867 RepID=A0A0C2Y6U5_HEBCY|nr:hypothetical protein M413DRAFT_448888 [Hebeloma cylindrosporum h7]